MSAYNFEMVFPGKPLGFEHYLQKQYIRELENETFLFFYWNNSSV